MRISSLTVTLPILLMMAMATTKIIQLPGFVASAFSTKAIPSRTSTTTALIRRRTTTPTPRRVSSNSINNKILSPPRIFLFSSSSSSSTNLSAESTKQADDSPTAVRVPRKFNPKPFNYHQELDIRIDSLTNMGWGVGRVSLDNEEEDDKEKSSAVNVSSSNDNDENQQQQRQWVIMVPHVVVGEFVRVRIFRNQRNYSEADLVEVLEASPERVQPKCSLAGVCGGCQYQHMSINKQREWKTQHVQEVLWQQQIDGYCESIDQISVRPTMGTDHIFGYRSKITPHYQAPREIGLDKYEIDAIGFQQSSNRNLVDVPECPIATDAINDEFKLVRNQLLEEASNGTLQVKRTKKRRQRKRNGGLLGATMLFRQADDDPVTGDPVVLTDNNEYMTTTVKDIKFKYLAGNFFQNNNYVLPLMVDAVVEAAIVPSSEGVIPSYLIDCYCGSGLFALSAASQFDLCVGIELNDKAVLEATNNAELNAITNCQFMAASAEAIFTSPPAITIEGFEDMKVQDFPRDRTVVVVDPPRKGCSTEFLQQLYNYGPQRIVYMSCGPATQARDAKGIVEIGGYDIISIQPIDLFPQTKHIECLMVFEKKKQPQQ